jgi:CheY-like chemotaxis protein
MPGRARILVVEDELTIAMDLAGLIDRLGHEPVGPAGSLARGLQLAEFEPLGAAIVDFNLRGEAATPVVRALRERNVPVILCTAYARSALPSDLRSLPRIDKPYGSEDVKSALMKVVKRAGWRSR